MTYPFGETVQILDGSVGEKTYNGDTRTWPVKATHEGCPVWPSDGNSTSGNEYTDDGQDKVIIGLTVSLPDGADVQPVDRAVVRGLTWEVVGQPGAFQSPFTGWRPGIPVALKRVTG